MRRRIAIGGVLATSVLLVSLSVFQTSSLPPVQADVPLRVAISADIRGTNPGVTRDGNTDAVLHHVVEGLVAYRQNLEVAPMLAEHVEVSPDFRTYSFRLREKLRFHNGAPVTSAEVKWSWERMLDPATGMRCRSWYDGSANTGFGAKIVRIETPDRLTAVFTLDKPNSVFLDQLASLQCITAILHPASVDKNGNWIGPIGTGPFRIREWRRGEFVDLERFDGYNPRQEPSDGYAGARIALAPRVRFVIIPEAAVGVSAVRAGDIDILPRTPAYVTAHLDLKRDGMQTSESEQLAWHTLLIQTQNPLFRDVRIRRAIAMALDPRQIAKIATLSDIPANPSAIPLLSPFHTKHQDKWWPYDPSEARRLLSQAGYRGQPVLIQTNRKTPFAFDNAVAIQAMLISVGIDARLDVLDWATQLSNYQEGKFQLSAFSYSARAHPVLSYAMFSGSKEKHAAVQWDDQVAQALLARSTIVGSLSEQQRIFDALHNRMVTTVPIIGLYNEPSSDLLRANIVGYRNWPIGYPRLWGVSRKGS